MAWDIPLFASKAKINIFWKVFNIVGPRPIDRGIIFKNVEFSLWGKQCGFPKLQFFSQILAHYVCVSVLDVVFKKNLTFIEDSVAIV